MSEIMDNLLRHYMNQDVAVLHFNQETEKTEVVAYVSVNKNLSDNKKLEMAFEKTNNIDCAWWENKEVEKAFKGGVCRSTSVGDVVRIEDKKYMCIPNGWKKIDNYPTSEEQTEWWRMREEV